MRSILKRGFVTLAILFNATLVLACGGFFAPVPMDQTSQRIVFLMNGDGAITTIQGIGYQGEASDFVWLLPVPSMPTVDVADVATLDALDRATESRILAPVNPCAGVVWSQYGDEGVGGGGGPQEGTAGPYDYVVLDENNAQAIVDWLQNAGYNVPDAIVPALETYVQQHMLFLAMKLRPTSDVGDIQPVKITYQGDKPVVAVQLAATSVSQPSLPFRVWIFGDTRYMAENYANPRVDFWSFRAIHGSLVSPVPYSGASETYFMAKQAVQDEYDGKAFVTEFAMPADAVNADGDVSDPALLDLLGKYKYVTRMEALMSADQMTRDATFMPVATAPDVSRHIDLGGFVDALHYWRCSTRDLLDTNPDALIDADTVVGDAHIGHPAGWIQSDFLLDLTTVVHVFSPEKVDIETLRAFIRGKATPPMFVVFGSAGDRWGRGDLRAALGFERFDALPDNQQWEETERYQLYHDVETGFKLHFEMLASQADFAAHGDVYRAMLDYAANYACYADPALRHTLFMAGGEGEQDANSWYVGFPAGWQDHSTSDGLAVILPDSVTTNTDPVDAPSIRIRPLGVSDGQRRDPVVKLLNSYGITDSAMLDSVSDSLCPPSPLIAGFDHDGRKGYLKLTGRFYVEASAPVAQFADFDTLLKQSAASLTEPIPLCG